jgi:hypothetical protein
MYYVQVSNMGDEIWFWEMLDKFNELLMKFLKKMENKARANDKNKKTSR